MTGSKAVSAHHNCPCRTCKRMLRQQWLHAQKAGLSALPTSDEPQSEVCYADEAGFNDFHFNVSIVG